MEALAQARAARQREVDEAHARASHFSPFGGNPFKTLPRTTPLPKSSSGPARQRKHLIFILVFSLR